MIVHIRHPSRSASLLLSFRSCRVSSSSSLQERHYHSFAVTHRLRNQDIHNQRRTIDSDRRYLHPSPRSGYSNLHTFNNPSKMAAQVPNGGSSDHTHLLFQENAKLYSHQVSIQSIIPFADLDEANRALYKAGTDSDLAIVTNETIFHPQGGGQPSDEGKMESSNATFDVAMVRMDAVNQGRVLHFGRFVSGTPDALPSGSPVTQHIDVDKRILYSKYHSAGHVLGAAVRALLENEIPGFDELKASHFPDSAACEFQGSIEGKWKADIQQKVDEYIAADMPIEIDWWSLEDFEKEGLQRLVPDSAIFDTVPGGKLRVVRIVGAEIYPCGGTHVDSTEGCGKTTVRKISRAKGTSRVSYLL